MTYFLAAAGFALLVILHEAGHFVAAKAVGMRVEKFYLFFPPAIWKLRRGETEYGVGAIPLGGFVKITGMNPEEKLDPEVAPRAYYNQPVWKRIVVIGAGPLVNLVIAFLLLFVLAFGVQEGTRNVGTVQAGYPAVGKLQPGDKLVGADGRRGGPIQIANRIGKHECAGKPSDGCRAKTPVSLQIVRDGQPQTVRIVPVYDAEVGRTRLGISYATRPLAPSVGGAANLAVDTMWRVTSGTVSAIAKIFQASERKKLNGIVGSYEVTRQAIGFGAREALTLIAIISLSLAIVNLFPFLPLDGGHIFWSLVEKIRGRPVPFRVIEGASAVGFILVLFLFAIGLSNDLSRLAGPGFHLR
jgi:regulator of sigma E protease